MFIKTFSTNLCAALLLGCVAGPSAAAPVRRADITLVEQVLVPVVPGAQIPPPIVDLFDQYENLQSQVNLATPEEPGYDELLEELGSTRANLDQSIQGVAVLVSSTSSSASAPSATSSSNASATSSASATGSASSSTISVLPSTSVNINAPVVTVVTQIGTSIVVIASQGLTSTVTLATITNVQSGTPSSTSVSLSSIASASGSSSTGLNSGYVTTALSPQGTAANSSAQQMTGAAFSLAQMAMKSQMLFISVGALLSGMLMVL